MFSGDLEYLLTSLPYLRFTDSIEERNRVTSIFKAYASSKESLSLTNILNQESAKYLSPKEQTLFKKIELDKIHTTEFLTSKYRVLSGFSTFFIKLKTELKSLRENRMQSSQFSKKSRNTIELEAGNPLDQEIQIMHLQWREVEKLSIGHFSDVDSLIGYKIKLLLLQRWWSFDREVGFERYLDLIKMSDNG